MNYRTKNKIKTAFYIPNMIIGLLQGVLSYFKSNKNILSDEYVSIGKNAHEQKMASILVNKSHKFQPTNISAQSVLLIHKITQG